MIVPMKKVAVLVLDSEKKKALQQLRKLGLLHIEISPGTGERLVQLKEQASRLEQALFLLEDLKEKPGDQQELDRAGALSQADQILALSEERKDCRASISAAQAELDRLKKWGDMDPADLQALAEKGITLSLWEMPLSEYQRLGEEIVTIPVNRDKSSVRFLVVEGKDQAEDARPAETYLVTPPVRSTAQLRQQVTDGQQRLAEIDKQLRACVCYTQSMRKAIAGLQKDAEFEGYATGMAREVLSDRPDSSTAVACLTGYLPTEDLDTLKDAARANAWGLASADPDEEDNVPTKLRNNKFVSLIYPLTDFLGTVPGYFEYDISSWFLIFMLVFFGIIFGDGGYGLLITGVAGAFIIKSKVAKKPVAPLWLLVGLFGIATIVWGLLTCTWFGLSADQIPQWLQNLSLPVLSNVNSDKLWCPPWTGGQVGLTTAQNVQIFCFSLALIQLTVAHVKGMIRNRRSLQALGDLGSILQLWGMFYVVLSLVVNGQVFPLGLVIGGVPVGTVAIVLVGVGFVLSFIFASYAGSIKDSVLDSCKNIISILLGVVNVFSDIVSYIRLWAVGLAGAAISATVNEMAGPMLGKLTFLVFAVILLVFGHGLNMILNVLSVIVHGVRLNTLEFSSHLGISWGGHKYEPFQE